MTELSETNVEPTMALAKKELETKLFRCLEANIGLAYTKIHLNGNSDKTKRSWIREFNDSVKTYGFLRRIVDLTDLENRIEILEQEKIVNFRR